MNGILAEKRTMSAAEMFDDSKSLLRAVLPHAQTGVEDFGSRVEMGPT